MTQISLDANQYESFFSVISMMRDMNTDIIIKNGVIRQRNIGDIIVYDIDMCDILDDISLAISGVNNRIDIFKLFLGSDNIEIISDEFNYIIKDDSIKISFVKPVMSSLKQEFMKKDDLSQMFDYDNRSLVMNHKFSVKLCERARIISNNYEEDYFIIEFKKDHASLIATNKSKNQTAVLSNEILLDDDSLDGKICYIYSKLINCDHDSELELQMYYDGGNILFNEVSTSIKGINYTLYNRTRLLDSE